LWEERRKILTARLVAHDRAFLVETASLFPEATLELLDREMLIDWARAEVSGDVRGAAAALDRTAELGDAWSAATRDPLPRDAVRRIRSLVRTRGGAQALARAHLAYRDAITSYRADDYGASAESTEVARAGFARAETPFWAWAALQKSIILFQRRQRDEADAELAPVEALARRRGYRTLLGRTLRQRGLTQSKLWHIDQALRLFQEAAECFEGAGQQESAAVVYSQIADMLRTLGEHHTSWEYIGKTLDGLSRMRLPLQRYLALFNASLFAANQDLFDAALLFQHAAVGEAMLRGGGPVIEALIQRATIFARRGNDDEAIRDLREAEAQLQALPDGPLKHYHRAQIDVLVAELSQTGRIAPDIVGLRQAIEFFSSVEPGMLPRLQLGLARAQLRLGSADLAERAFEQGIERLEGQQSRLDDEAFRISYFDDSWGLFPEMIQFQVDVRHDVNHAFEYAERSRARLLLAAASAAPPRATTLLAVQGALPDSVVLLYYVTLSDRLLTWSVTSHGHQLFETRVPRDQLKRLAARFRASVTEPRETASSAGDQLYDLLIRPALSTLTAGATVVLVTDGDLQQVPFAALKDAAGARYLIEDHPLLQSPSAGFFVAGLAHGHALARQPLESALLVGNPTPDAEPAALKPLPGAESEVRATAALYPRHLVLTGRSATKDRFVDAAPGFDVVHFGGHALVNAEYPLMSRLLFAAEGEPAHQQSLFAYEISRLRLPQTRLVILAACSTAAGTVSRGEGVVSVARPFLAAGVPLVIASQWDVDDLATEQLFLAFHRALAESHDAISALRTAQLSLLHSSNHSFAEPRNWSAFVALGTVTR
jgi:CHAT domain-containing protein/tetratricopeptide (TPR) repeat protein